MDFTNFLQIFAASCGGVSTALINCESGTSGIGSVLRLAVNIFTVGVGVLAAIGIVVFGIQWLTAHDNEQQVVKARKRLLNIVIGLAVYVGFFAIMNFLLPDTYDDALDNIDSSIAETDAQAVARQKALADALKNQATYTSKNSLTSSTSLYTGSGSGSGGSGAATTKKGAAAIAYYAEQNAWPIDDKVHNCLMTTGIGCGDGTNNVLIPAKTPNSAYKAALLKYITTGGGSSTPIDVSVVQKDNNFWGQGASCDVFTGTAVREAIGDMNFPFRGPDYIRNYMIKSSDWTEVNHGGKWTNLQPGDVMTRVMQEDGKVRKHAEIFLGMYNSSKPLIAQGAYMQHTGLINNYTHSLSEYRVFRYTGA